MLGTKDIDLINSHQLVFHAEWFHSQGNRSGKNDTPPYHSSVAATRRATTGTFLLSTRVARVERAVPCAHQPGRCVNEWVVDLPHQKNLLYVIL